MINLIEITWKKGELGVAQVLIKHGANPNIGGERTGWRPLQEAVKNGNQLAHSIPWNIYYNSFFMDQVIWDLSSF